MQVDTPPSLTREDCSRLMHMASDWADAAGLLIRWIGLPAATSQALVMEDAGCRAHWRCALELVAYCVEASGRDVADLLDDLALQPVQQNTERPGA